jgi:aspartyl-tRNA synthetase
LLLFPEGIKLLQDDGLTDVDPLGDLNTELERRLGKIVKDKYGTDFYILHRYPMAVSVTLLVV